MLPNSVNSSKNDIQEFFKKHPIIESDNIQYGKTKVVFFFYLSN